MTEPDPLKAVLEADIRKRTTAPHAAAGRLLSLRLRAHKYRKQIVLVVLLGLGVAGYAIALAELFASLEETPAAALIVVAYILAACMWIGFMEAD